MKFSTIETTLIAKWFGNKIDEIIYDNEGKNDVELIARISEGVEQLIMEDLQLLSEGYVSEMIHEGIKNIQYHELLSYFKNE